MKIAWDFDMTTAPRGDYVTEKRSGPKGSEIEMIRHVPVKIWAAGPSENFTGVTWWDAKREAWAFFAKDYPPIAWAELLLHPELMKD